MVRWIQTGTLTMKAIKPKVYPARKAPNPQEIAQAKAFLAEAGFRVIEPKVDPIKLQKAKEEVQKVLRDYPGITIGMLISREKPRYRNPKTGEIYQHKGGKGVRKPEWAIPANRIKD